MKLRTLFRFIVLLLALQNQVMGQFSTDHLLVSIHDDDYYAYPPRPPFIVSEALRKSIQDQTNVAQRLTKQLLLNKDNNFVFSPLSIHVILSMIANGAKGSNQAEMLKFLNASSIQEVNTLASNVAHLFANGSQLGGPNLTFVNGVWIDQSLTINPSFKKVMDDAHKADLKQVDFINNPAKARNEVNSWAEKETNSLIKSILPPNAISTLTRLILANALYFKGEWGSKFDASHTSLRVFHLPHNATPIKTHFMKKGSSTQYVSVFNDFKVLKLPYDMGKDYNRRFSMYVYLPNDTNGLPDLIKQFGSSNFIDRA